MAPTWQQDDKGRNIIPFGVTENEFLRTLNIAARKNNALVIFRAHLGSGDGVDGGPLTNIVSMPMVKFPDTEELLYITDILITDWSSIAMDYLSLSRPVIFIDVKPPFHYLSLSDKFRYGEKVASMDELVKAVATI